MIENLISWLTQIQPLLAVYPIKHALLRLDPSCSTFTSSHAIFIRLCLQARAYRCALQIIEKDICHFPTSSDKLFLRRSELLLWGRHESSMSFITAASGLSGRLTHRHYLEYFLYGGMIYIGLKQWENALHFLNIVITVPTSNSVSLIMVEAYKKWVLVCLLERGMVSLSRFVSRDSSLTVIRMIAVAHTKISCSSCSKSLQIVGETL